MRIRHLVLVIEKYQNRYKYSLQKSHPTLSQIPFTPSDGAIVFNPSFRSQSPGEMFTFLGSCETYLDDANLPNQRADVKVSSCSRWIKKRKNYSTDSGKPDICPIT